VAETEITNCLKNCGWRDDLQASPTALVSLIIETSKPGLRQHEQIHNVRPLCVLTHLLNSSMSFIHYFFLFSKLVSKNKKLRKEKRAAETAAQVQGGNAPKDVDANVVYAPYSLF